MKTSWTAYAGVITFLLPDRSQYAISAKEIDHPVSICELVDAAEKLSAGERQALIAMLSQLGMRSATQPTEGGPKEG